MILTYDDALTAISEGETDWKTLTQRVGRNHLPAILSEVVWSMTTTELAAALRDAWVSAEHPEARVSRRLMSGAYCRLLVAASIRKFGRQFV